MSGRGPRRRRGGQDRRPERAASRDQGAGGHPSSPIRSYAETGLDHPRHGDVEAHELPHETLTPITLAAGIALLGFGVLTSPLFSVVGVAVMAWALWKWIGEMQHG